MSKETSFESIKNIRKVEGFEPDDFVQSYTNADGETVKKLPANIMKAWFRLVYPNGRIAVDCKCTSNGVFVAKARVYADRLDPEYAFIAEGSTSRQAIPDQPGINIREWSQTAAICVALRNAGFGLHYDLIGEAADTAPIEQPGDVSFFSLTEEDEAAARPIESVQTAMTVDAETGEVKVNTHVKAKQPEPPKELTPEEKFAKACSVACPIKKFAGKTLGEVLREEPGAIKWIAGKNLGEATEAAEIIVQYAIDSEE